MSKNRIFTIGYEGADPDRFLTTLESTGVEVLADVRAVALSRKRGFSKSLLRENLSRQGIDYRHYINLGTPKEGRQASRAGDAELMRGIYCSEVLSTEEARSSLMDLEALARNQIVCLLCFERDPAGCHRRILAELLTAKGFEAVDLTVIS